MGKSKSWFGNPLVCDNKIIQNWFYQKTWCNEDHLHVRIQHGATSITFDRVVAEVVWHILNFLQWSVPGKNNLIQLGSEYNKIIFFSYMHPNGTTILVASRREDGQTFQEKRTPSRCSGPYKSHCCIVVVLS